MEHSPHEVNDAYRRAIGDFRHYRRSVATSTDRKFIQQQLRGELVRAIGTACMGLFGLIGGAIAIVAACSVVWP